MTEIVRRLEPCDCGCYGSDPWHQRSYLRKLYDRQPASGRGRTLAMGVQPVVETAWAHLPWGEGRRVRVVRVELRHQAEPRTSAGSPHRRSSER